MDERIPNIIATIISLLFTFIFFYCGLKQLKEIDFKSKKEYYSDIIMYKIFGFLITTFIYLSVYNWSYSKMIQS
jgi:hypothetical protein